VVIFIGIILFHNIIFVGQEVEGGRFGNDAKGTELMQDADGGQVGLLAEFVGFISIVRFVFQIGIVEGVEKNTGFQLCIGKQQIEKTVAVQEIEAEGVWVE